MKSQSPLRIVSGATRTPARTIPIDRHARRRVADGLRSMAEAAERGEIAGVVYGVIGPDGQTRQGWFGNAPDNPALAHYTAARLAHLLLWPEDLAPAP